MPTNIPISPSNLSLYNSNKEILSRAIDVSKLPMVGESKIFKSTAERYGHVIIKLSLETEVKATYGTGGTYSWEVNENEDVASKEKNAQKVYVPIPRDFESEIFNEIKTFVTILRFVNQDDICLRFSVVGGSYRVTERPYFSRATAEAIIEIFKKLHDL